MVGLSISGGQHFEKAPVSVSGTKAILFVRVLSERAFCIDCVLRCHPVQKSRFAILRSRTGICISLTPKLPRTQDGRGPAPRHAAAPQSLQKYRAPLAYPRPTRSAMT